MLEISNGQKLVGGAADHSDNNVNNVREEEGRQSSESVTYNVSNSNSDSPRDYDSTTSDTYLKLG